MRLVLTSLAVAAVAAFSSAALAGPALPTVDYSNLSMVEKVVGCHRGVESGPRGWHYHAGPECRTVFVPGPRYEGRPRGYYDDDRGYDDRPRRYGQRQVCLPKCRYVGPFKEC